MESQANEIDTSLMAIYPINPVICHPLITLWPAKIKTLAFTFASLQETI
jgi:hypothetical protein